MEKFREIEKVPENSESKYLSEIFESPIISSENSIFKLMTKKIFSNELNVDFLKIHQVNFLSSLLETPETNRHADELIHSVVREWGYTRLSHLPGIPAEIPTRPSVRPSESEPDRESPAMPRDYRLPFSFHSRGLSARSTRAASTWQVEGEDLLRGGDECLRIDFMPHGRHFVDRTRLTESLVMGIRGIAELLEAVDGEERAEIPKVLMGQTNINMALIAQRLGFRIVDQDRLADGKIDLGLGYYTVVGKLADVRRRLAEFVDSGRAERLAIRHNRRNGK